MDDADGLTVVDARGRLECGVRVERNYYTTAH